MKSFKQFISKRKCTFSFNYQQLKLRFGVFLRTSKQKFQTLINSLD